MSLFTKEEQCSLSNCPKAKQIAAHLNFHKDKKIIRLKAQEYVGDISWSGEFKLDQNLELIKEFAIYKEKK